MGVAMSFAAVPPSLAVNEILGAAATPLPLHTELLLTDLVVIPMIAVAAFLWVFLVPMPAPRIGISPVGLILDFGLRTERFPWDRVFCVGALLVTVSPRIGVRASYRLDDFQADRVNKFLNAGPRATI